MTLVSCRQGGGWRVNDTGFMWVGWGLEGK